MAKFFYPAFTFIMRQILFLFITYICILFSSNIHAFYSSENSQQNNLNPSPYLQYIDSADHYISKEKWELAEKYILKALRNQPANPTNTLLFTNLGICQLNLNRPSDALRSLEIAAIKAPSSTKVLLNKARALYLLNNREDALIDLNNAISKDSLNADILRLRGSILQQKGSYEEAANDFKTMTAIQPDNAWAWASLGSCLAQLENHKDARNAFSKAISLSNEPEIYQATALYYITQNDFLYAKEIITTAISKFPHQGELYLVRALIHLNQFQHSDAELDKKTALSNGVSQEILNRWFPNN